MNVCFYYVSRPKRPPYYFSIPLQEPDALSGVPEYLRIIAKPVCGRSQWGLSVVEGCVSACV